MKWQRGYQSDDVEDRRGRPARRGLQLSGGGLVVGIIVMLVFGKDYLGITQTNTASSASSTTNAVDPAQDELKQFVSFVFDDAQRVWATRYPGPGAYQKAKMVLFTGEVKSACGFQSAAVGPFYCPADQKVYIDLSFYAELKNRFKAGGDFAQAYVIAHEVGHHVQTLMGTNARVHREGKANPLLKNKLSVKMELQADCYAGVWAHDTKRRDLLEVGDLEESLNAAKAIGDDTIQKRAGVRVRPESFTHGTSAERMKWFKRGYDTGDVAACDTF